MDTLGLLKTAQSSGLTVEARGEQLVVKGHPSLEPLAHQLLDEKAAVMSALSISKQVELEGVALLWCDSEPHLVAVYPSLEIRLQVPPGFKAISLAEFLQR